VINFMLGAQMKRKLAELALEDKNLQGRLMLPTDQYETLVASSKIIQVLPFQIAGQKPNGVSGPLGIRQE